MRPINACGGSRGGDCCHTFRSTALALVACAWRLAASNRQAIGSAPTFNPWFLGCARLAPPRWTAGVRAGRAPICCSPRGRPVTVRDSIGRRLGVRKWQTAVPSALLIRLPVAGCGAPADAQAGCRRAARSAAAASQCTVRVKKTQTTPRRVRGDEGGAPVWRAPWCATSQPHGRAQAGAAPKSGTLGRRHTVPMRSSVARYSGATRDRCNLKRRGTQRAGCAVCLQTGRSGLLEAALTCV